MFLWFSQLTVFNIANVKFIYHKHIHNFFSKNANIILIYTFLMHQFRLAQVTCHHYCFFVSVRDTAFCS